MKRKLKLEFIFQKRTKSTTHILFKCQNSNSNHIFSSQTTNAISHPPRQQSCGIRILPSIPSTNIFNFPLIHQFRGCCQAQRSIECRSVNQARKTALIRLIQTFHRSGIGIQKLLIAETLTTETLSERFELEISLMSLHSGLCGGPYYNPPLFTIRLTNLFIFNKLVLQIVKF